MKFWDLVHPDHREDVRERGFARQRGEQVSNRYEFKINCKNGSVRWLDFTAGVINWQGKTAGIGIALDVTAHKHAEEILRVSESKSKAIFEGSNDAIMLLSDNVFFDCNPRTLEMFGFKRKEDFIGLHPFDISPLTQPNGMKSQEASQKQIEMACQQGSSNFEWIHRRANGRNFPTEVLLSAFDYGEKRVLQATVRDITERKQAEEDLRRAAEEMHAIFWQATVIKSDDETKGAEGFIWNTRYSNLDIVQKFLVLPDYPKP